MSMKLTLSLALHRPRRGAARMARIVSLRLWRLPGDIVVERVHS
jgi:hypothetical protein